jgi:Fe-S cluster biogenesis protein NfuA
MSLPVDLTITIRAEASWADADTCRFVVNRRVHPGGPFLFDLPERAEGSPLAERLFALVGVASVLVAENVVTVGKDPSASWSGLKTVIGAAIRTQLGSGIPAILEASRPAGTGARTDTELCAVIRQLLEREVNRSIARHGGQISLVGVRDRKLFIKMSGGCQGCVASQVTLRQGLERMVRRIAPEILEIVDTTDHAAGAEPFYQSSTAQRR